jgi:putative peptide zinc metalloprotease protein
VAWSKCESCQTTAIAIEIVLVEGSPSTVAPQNVAVAVNESCTLCDTFATAYQFVVGTDGPVRFTRDGLKELKQIRKEIDSWGDRHLSNDQIKALLPDVVARIKRVLAEELRPVRNRHERDNDENEKSHKHDSQPNAPPASTAATETGTVEVTTMPTTTEETTTTAETTTTPTTTETGTTTTTPTPTTTSP